MHRFGDAARIVRVDDECGIEARRGAGKARQDQDARILLILGGDIFHRDEVHAVAQGVTRPIDGQRKKPAKTLRVQAMGHIAQRHPIELGVFAVDLAGEPVECALQFAIFADILARARRHLKVAYFLAVFGVSLEEFGIGLETLRQALWSNRAGRRR